MPISRRLIRKTKFFSHQLLEGSSYRPRTGNEQRLAECYENQLDDDYTVQEKIDVILAIMTDDDQKKLRSSILTKYHELPESRLMYKLYKIESQLKRHSQRQKPKKPAVCVLPGGVFDMTSDDEGAGGAVPVSDEILLGMDRKKKLLRKVLHEKMRQSFDNKSRDEIKHMMLELKNVVHSVEGSVRDHEISSFDEQQRIFFMKIIIAEEIVSELQVDMNCPITHCLMQDPVTTCNGHNYDRKRYSPPTVVGSCMMSAYVCAY